MQSRCLLLYAPNVHSGGGFVLLNALLEAWPDDLPLFAWLDARAQASLRIPMNAQIEWVRPSIKSRLRAEYSLSKVAVSDDRILCFHGLPPLLPNKGEVLIFQQNRNYLGLVSLHSFGWRTRQRLRLEQTVAYLFRHRCATYWVQTPSMARELQKWFGEEPINIRVMPFLHTAASTPASDSPRWDFVYVADGEAHKNHRCLVEAWTILATRGLRPTLALTLTDRDGLLRHWLQQQIAEHGLQITDLGHLPHEKLLHLYGQSRALIFPSISESYGLPLVEAHQVGLSIVAAELDFVRDVCQPVQTFDPYSPVSISRAVLRFLGQTELLVEPVRAEAFLSAVMSERSTPN